jgi:ribose transport system ATP-binding protein
MPGLSEPPILEITGLTKSFGGTQALDDVAFSVQPGEVHGLIGQNGAGKSTLVKILAGYHAPDAGSIMLRGQHLALPMSPRELRRRGVGLFHQNLALVPSLSILDNLHVGRHPKSALSRLRIRDEETQARRVLQRASLYTSPDQLVSELSQAERAMLSFVRALEDAERRPGGLLILDEPTAYLPGTSVNTILRYLREFVDNGGGVVFVSHRLDEVRRFTDRITVLRDGKLVGVVDTRLTSEEAMISMMLGRELGQLYPATPAPKGDLLLEANALRSAVVKGVSFSLHVGEVLGLTGLIGMGHDDVPYIAYGSAPDRDGTISVDSQTIAVSAMNPVRARKLGMGLLPADREGESGVLAASLMENLTLTCLNDFFRRGKLMHREERRHATRLATSFEVRPTTPEARLGDLSGGNQQKALLAKWLHIKPRIQFLHEPTQGVDIGSRRQIFQLIEEAARNGTAFIISSSEYEDLAHICTRVLIFRSGTIVGELSGGSLTGDKITELCYRTV